MTNPYEKAGVDVNSGYEVSNFVKQNLAKQKANSANIGNFGGVYEIPEGYKHPVLISGNDGVGTKLMLSIEGKKYDTVGIDCVAMCVNDLLAQGATPQYFMDYIATGKVDGKIKEVLKGIISGCEIGQVDLVGGETAEMPGMYREKDYDLAGFAVGIVEKENILTKANVKKGDKLIGIKSSGLHSNGFSLIRKIFFKDNEFNYVTHLPEMPTENLGDVLLTPTRIYTNEIVPLLEKHLVHGIAHITGGGFYENVPRALPDNLAARIDINTWEKPDIYDVVKKYGGLKLDDMYHIFNMGIGMVLAVSEDQVEIVLDSLNQCCEQASVIGVVVDKTEDSVELKGDKL
ncbi:phosphoribosylformylglycinamidine cyclo-ligase [Companilactobacillus ginsenosidimutans]|uniref:Phosphoribosylformylglycinamidine cyclo-ligase n=1 Tax=Companilactobacillus ginsenosidimutans TaxID=1007676 RepID=A0A0H4QYV7_9LACO|nr:phosphoribosylformylglycinamidine cyclo-ligase [Companilactobacillus ginsenosidimutans]AKP66680.1 phosphoribosylaminoimidazole synthetase [Companilactobacillus ginsenosidimutans]